MQLMQCIKNGQIMARNASTGGLKVMAIRREDQSLWERRAPLGPQHVRKLVKEGVKVIVQPSNRRCYPMQAYANAGAIIKEDLSEASVIFGVKQVPIDSLQRDKTFVFFSHTIKVRKFYTLLLNLQFYPCNFSSSTGTQCTVGSAKIYP